MSQVGKLEQTKLATKAAQHAAKEDQHKAKTKLAGTNEALKRAKEEASDTNATIEDEAKVQGAVKRKRLLYGKVDQAG